MEKVTRACVFYFYFVSFLQGQIEIFDTGDNFTFSKYHEKCISIIEADRKIGYKCISIKIKDKMDLLSPKNN